MRLPIAGRVPISGRTGAAGRVPVAGRASGFTPANVAALADWYDVDLGLANGGLLDGSGAPVTNGVGIATAADVRGGTLFSQATPSKRFALDTGTKLRGRPSMAGTKAALSSLARTTGGIPGAQPFTCYTVAALVGNPGNEVDAGIGAYMGSQAAGLVTGTFNNGSTWALTSAGGGGSLGGGGQAQSTTATDPWAHCVRLTYDGSNVIGMWLDGLQVIATTTTLALGAGWGFCGKEQFSLEAVNWSVWGGALFAGTVTPTQIALLDAYYSDRFGLLNVIAWGDSLTLGKTTPDAGGPGHGDIVSTYLPPRLRGAGNTLGCGHVNRGIIGQTSMQILARIQAGASAYQWGGTCVHLLCMGTNDFFAGASAASVYANYLSAASLIHAMGGKVIALGIPSVGPTPTSGKPIGFDGSRASLHTMLAASTAFDAYVPPPARLNQTDAGTWPNADYGTDWTHLTMETSWNPSSPIAAVSAVGYDYWSVPIAAAVAKAAAGVL